MRIESLNGFQIWESDGHGKACKGQKATTGIQVREYIGTGYLLLKTINFPIGNKVKREVAIKKAREYILNN